MEARCRDQWRQSGLRRKGKGQITGTSGGWFWCRAGTNLGKPTVISTWPHNYRALFLHVKFLAAGTFLATIQKPAGNCPGRFTLGPA